MKKLLFVIVAFLAFPSFSLATAGACSSHGGVNCSAGADMYGKVQCNDGWTNSSVYFSNTDECNSDDLIKQLVKVGIPITPEIVQSEMNKFCNENNVGSLWDNNSKKCTLGMLEKEIILQKYYNQTLEELPQYKSIAKLDDIRKLAQDPANADKTFTQIFAIAYPNVSTIPVPPTPTISTLKPVPQIKPSVSKPITPTPEKTTIKNVKEQVPNQPVVENHPNPVKSNNIFSNFWNFIKSIF